MHEGTDNPSAQSGQHGSHCFQQDLLAGSRAVDEPAGWRAAHGVGEGQEAPAVIYSMATSSADEAPRGLDFLYDPHRLNVATSRARTLAIIVASPDLIRVSCRTPHQMVLANALCRAWETGG